MGFYPIFVQLTGRPCLVVGGGEVATGKVEGLLAAGAAVTVVSPVLTPALRRHVAAGRVRHEARAYRTGDVGGFALAFAATGDDAVNAAVAADARRHGVWLNAADDPARCDFILPALLRRGVVTVAVSTGGASPALAGVVRDAAARAIGDDYGALATVAADVRTTLRAERRAVPPRTWRDALADTRVRRLAAAGRAAAARARLRARLTGDDAESGA